MDEADSWRTHTTGPYSMKVHRGGHFYLNDHQTDILKSIVDHLTAG